MTDTTQSTAQVITSTAAQTVQALLPALLVNAATGLSAPQIAALTLLPSFIQAGEAIVGARIATPEQLTAMWTEVSSGVQTLHDRLQADLTQKGIPAILAKQAA